MPIKYPRSKWLKEMQPLHRPRRYNLTASCNERLERNEGQHLLEDKVTGRRCLAFLLLCVEVAANGKCCGARGKVLHRE